MASRYDAGGSSPVDSACLSAPCYVGAASPDRENDAVILNVTAIAILLLIGVLIVFAMWAVAYNLVRECSVKERRLPRLAAREKVSTDRHLAMLRQHQAEIEERIRAREEREKWRGVL